MSNLLQLVSWHKKQNKGFCIYRWPHENKINLVSGAATSDNASINESVFVFQAFDSKKDNVSLLEDLTLEESTLDQILSSSTAQLGLETETIDETVDTMIAAQTGQSTPFELYSNAFNKAQEAINSGELKKVIISKVEVIDYDSTDTQRLFQTLLATRPETMCYCFYHPNAGFWIGASPELVIRKTGDNFRTSSIAGTKNNESTEWTSKELEEQQIVTEFISKELSKSGANVDVGELKTVQAGNVLHLKQLIDFTIPSGNMQHVIDTLHPTPAISGFPKKKAMELISQIEAHERKYYCGIIGRMSETDARVYVNLRCAEISSNAISIYTGGGITKDSQLEAEWNECARKAEGIKKLI